MRVTNNMILNNFKNNFNRNLEKMNKLQGQLASGKEINKPSDNPFLATRAMAFKTNIEQNEQYKRNIEDSIGWLDMTDSALGNMTESLHRIKELSLYGSNGTLSDNDRNIIKSEIEGMVGEFFKVGNTKYDGRYIFGGRENNNSPFAMENGIYTYKGDDRLQKVEVAENIVSEINVTGDRIYNNTGDNIGEIFKDLMDGLETGDDNLLSGAIGKLDNYTDKFLTLRAEVGTKTNGLQAALEQNNKQTLDMTEMLSKTEDVDYAQKIMEYSNMESIYKASLSTGAKSIQPTLLDFLR